MYDYIKLTINGTSPAVLFNNPMLDFERVVSENTGQIKSVFKQAYYKGLKFKIFDSKRIELSGSLHKYYNNNTGNYDDFTLGNVCTVIDELQSKFAINPRKTTISRIEFGVNVLVDTNAVDFINKFYMYKMDFFVNANVGMKGYMKVMEKSEYKIKVYDKSLQYDLPEQTLRFEIHIKKMQQLKRLGVHLSTLEDLLNPNLGDDLGEILNMYLSKIILREIDLLEINNTRIKSILTKYYYTGYWNSLRAQQTSKNPNKARREMKKFEALITQYGDSSLHVIQNLIVRKWNSLNRGWDNNF